MENEKAGPKKLYVGSVPYNWTSEQLEELFKPYGRIASVSIVTDQATRKSKGFGFVEVENEEIARKIIAEMNGKEIEGRVLSVREAKGSAERTQQSSGDRNRGQRPNYNHQSLDDTESTDTSGRGYGNRRGWW